MKPTIRQLMVHRLVNFNEERERSMRLARIVHAMFPHHRTRALLYVQRGFEAQAAARSIGKHLRLSAPRRRKETAQ